MIAVGGLVHGSVREKILAKIVSSGIPADDAGLILDEAKKRIQIAADYNRDEQLGLAIARINRAIEIMMPDEIGLEADPRGAVYAQKELNKLLRLHEVNPGNNADGSEEPASDRADELMRVREHLAPHFDVPDDYPVSELARMAADRIGAHGGADAET